MFVCFCLFLFFVFVFCLFLFCLFVVFVFFVFFCKINISYQRERGVANPKIFYNKGPMMLTETMNDSVRGVVANPSVNK